MCLRVYAVTGRNKLLGGALSVIIVMQLCFGTYYTIGAVRNPCKFLSYLFIRMRTHCGPQYNCCQR